MNGLYLDLPFACCRCEEITTITVHCTGKGLAAGPRTVAAAHAPCYHCGCVHQVCFHPTGELIAADPVFSPVPCLVPSNN